MYPSIHSTTHTIYCRLLYSSAILSKLMCFIIYFILTVYTHASIFSILTAKQIQRVNQCFSISWTALGLARCFVHMLCNHTNILILTPLNKGVLSLAHFLLKTFWANQKQKKKRLLLVLLFFVFSFIFCWFLFAVVLFV